jgi:glycosyltransferase involved in cell wall biosynthesis
MRSLDGLRVTFLAGTLGQGGAERQLFYIVQALRRSGSDVRVLCLTQGEFWEDRIRALNVPVSFAGQSSWRLARLARIVAELRARRPDVLQSQHFYTNLYATAAARMLHLPEIGAIRNDTVSEVRANGRVFGSWSLRLPRTVAANSRQGMANALSLGVPAARVRFLPNVVDSAHFAPRDGGSERDGVRDRMRDNERDNERDRGELRLLVVGRLTRQKRVDRFLDVLSCLRSRSGIDARATIAGAGPLREELERQADSLGLHAPVLRFAGAVADTRDLYRDADVLVLTSEWEGTPNVLLEAMSSGLAVVSTRVGGVSDIVRDGETGVLIDDHGDQHTVRAFCDALTAMGREPGRRRDIGGRARAFVVQQHSLEALPRVLSELYRSVLS